LTDLFAALGLPRSPWLEPEEIKERHHAAIAIAHPDKSNAVEISATILNEARRVLENPALRLRHLIALEFPNQKPASAPPLDWNFFQRIGETTMLASDLVAKLHAAKQPIVRASILGRVASCIHSIENLQKEVAERREALQESLREASREEWKLDTLQVLAEEWTFLERSANSLREARLQF
jgi:hypothetical protein